MTEGPSTRLPDASPLLLLPNDQAAATDTGAAPVSAGDMQVDQPLLSCSSSTTSYSITTGQDIDLEPFTLVQRRKRRRDSKTLGATSHLAVTPPQHGLTIILKPKDPGTLITKVHPLKIHEKLESIYPAGVISIRPNPRLNLLALDTRNSEATKAFLALTCLGSVSIQAYEPRSQESSVGVIRGVTTELSEDDLRSAIRSNVHAKQVRRLGSSEIVKLVFTSSTPPAHVTIGYTRFPVLPYIERPPKCSKCCGFGHVESTCNRPARCTRCSKTHDGTACDAEKPHCPNCRRNHESSSTRCPVYKREQAIYQHKRENKTDYLTAKNVILSAKFSPSLTQSNQDSHRQNSSRPATKLSSTDEFPELPHRSGVPGPDTTNNTTFLANSKTSARNTVDRSSNSQRKLPLSSAQDLPSLAVMIRRVVEIVQCLLAPLTYPIALAISSLIESIFVLRLL